MGGQAAHATKVIGCVHQAATEMILPDSIHDRPPRQRVLRADQPLGESGPAESFGMVRGKLKAGGKVGKASESSGGDFGARLLNASPAEQVDRARLAALGARSGEGAGTLINRSDKRRALRGQLVPLGLNVLQFLLDGGQGGLVFGSGYAGQQIGPGLFQRSDLGVAQGILPGIPAVGQIDLLPTHGSLNGVEGRHDRTSRDILAVGGECRQFGQSKDVIVQSGRELGGRDSEVTGGATAGGHLDRLKFGIGEVGLGVVSDEQRTPGEFRIVGDFHPEADWEAKPVSNLVEVVVAGMEHHGRQGLGLAQIHLDPLRQFRLGFNGAVVAVGFAALN